MKKLIAAILSLVLLGMMALPAAAQGRNWNCGDQGYSRDRNADRRDNYNRSNRRDYDRSRIADNAYNDRRSNAYYDYNGYDNRSFWDKHRDKLTTAMGAVGGAAIGGVGDSAGSGSGLRGLADRVEALGGQFTISSPPGRGTRLRAQIPCA